MATSGADSAKPAVQKIGVLQPGFIVCRDTIKKREMERRNALVGSTALLLSP
jgi:hypothetical protein